MSRTQEARAAARQVLKDRSAAAVLGLTDGDDGVRPALFRSAAEIETLVVDPKVPLAKTATRILNGFPPDSILAVVCRGCDQRAFVELKKINRLDPGRLVTIGIACTAEQAAACRCPEPYPDPCRIGERVPGVHPVRNDAFRSLFDDDPLARGKRWAGFFQACIKCYGCRNACPLCICEPCRLEDPVFVSRGDIPPEPLTFHLIRAFHLADRCVACGACEEACPAGIPLLALQQALRDTLEDRYGYTPGKDPDRRSPLLTDLLGEPEKGRELPSWETGLDPKKEDR